PWPNPLSRRRVCEAPRFTYNRSPFGSGMGFSSGSLEESANCGGCTPRQLHILFLCGGVILPNFPLFPVFADNFGPFGKLVDGTEESGNIPRACTWQARDRGHEGVLWRDNKSAPYWRRALERQRLARGLPRIRARIHT